MKATPKPPHPICKAMLICQEAEEHDDGTITLHGIGTKFVVPALPGETAPFTIFLQFMGCRGDYHLSLQFIDLQSDGEGPPPLDLGGGRITDPTKLCQALIHYGSIRVSRAAKYDVVVLANGDELERRQIEIVEGWRDSEE